MNTSQGEMNYGTVESITRWFAASRPIPSQFDASVQLGVHFEEIGEMADAFLLVGMTDEMERELIDFINRAKAIAVLLKTHRSGIDFFSIEPGVRKDILDSYMDQLVTVIGSAYTQHYDVLGAAAEVDSSNWSKFDEDGNPIFDENKKVKKGPNYRKAVLDSFVLDVVMSIPPKQEKQTTTASMEYVMNELIQVSTDASYEELRDAQDRLNAQIEAKRADARAEAITKIVGLVTEFELSADELNRALVGKGKPGRKPGSKSTRSTVAPKYRNPADPSQTWTGRGVAPAWIKDVPKDERGPFLIEQPKAEPEPASSEVAPVEATAPIFGNGASEE